MFIYSIIIFDLFFSVRQFSSTPKRRMRNTVFLKYLPKDILPKVFVARYEHLDREKLIMLKKNYAKVAGIYLWYNKVNGKTYVGRSVNLKDRIEDYMDMHNYKRNKGVMSIFHALRKYGFEKFELYIVEIIPAKQIQTLPSREQHWVVEVNPSYNLASVTRGYIGENHPNYGKPLPQEVRQKISKTMTGRKLPKHHRDNISAGHPKKEIFCYDFNTGAFVTKFDGIRIMQRALNLSGHTVIRRKVDNDKPFTCVYKGVDTTWRIYSKPKPNKN
jgi:GIY-YIG catalytic domain